MTNYFEHCQSLDEAKRLYKNLARQHHPDAGGDVRTMQEINGQYSDFCTNYAKTDARTRQKEAHAQGRKSAADYHDMDAIGAEIKIMIDFALTLEGVDVELMGLWVWLTGNTRAHAETLKEWNRTHEQKWKYSPVKKAWYFASVPTFSRQNTPLEQIRATYGATRFERKDDKREKEERRAERLHA